MYKQNVYLLTIAVFLGLSISPSLLANTNPNTFIDNGNGSVTDTTTGLSWQQQDDNITRTYANAITYCQGLSLADGPGWRLPNIKEFATVVDYRADSPAIDGSMFPNTNSSLYWSASSRESAPDNAWYVNFTLGNVFSVIKTNLNYVRCVR